MIHTRGPARKIFLSLVDHRGACVSGRPCGPARAGNEGWLYLNRRIRPRSLLEVLDADALGVVRGAALDSNDRVWLRSSPGSLTVARCFPRDPRSRISADARPRLTRVVDRIARRERRLSTPATQFCRSIARGDPVSLPNDSHYFARSLGSTEHWKFRLRSRRRAVYGRCASPCSGRGCSSRIMRTRAGAPPSYAWRAYSV
jgi:hypothetical protein